MTTIYLVMGSAGEYDDFREWVVKAFTDKTAAELHVMTLQADQARFNELVEKAYAFQKEWSESNPRPTYEADKILKEKKWTGLRNNQITKEMRDERERIRNHNNAIQQNYGERVHEWNDRQTAATKVFLEGIRASAEHIQRITGSLYFSERNAHYSVDETELD